MIYEALDQIAQQFIEENEEEISHILKVEDLNNEDNELYEIFTNYLDSNLRFKDEKIQELFENSKYQV